MDQMLHKLTRSSLPLRSHGGPLACRPRLGTYICCTYLYSVVAEVTRTLPSVYTYSPNLTN